jgi:hypothetical protein
MYIFFSFRFDTYFQHSRKRVRICQISEIEVLILCPRSDGRLDPEHDDEVIRGMHSCSGDTGLPGPSFRQCRSIRSSELAIDQGLIRYIYDEAADHARFLIDLAEQFAHTFTGTMSGNREDSIMQASWIGYSTMDIGLQITKFVLELP